MKALVYQGNGQCALEDRPVPKIQDPTDAIVKGKLWENSSIRVFRGGWTLYNEYSDLHNNLRNGHAHSAWRCTNL